MTPNTGVGRLADLFLLDESERCEWLLMPIRTVGGNLAVPANGYLDETEHDDIVGVGGWLGTFESWQRFEPRWKALLPPEAKGDFHYTDFWHDPKHWSVNWPHARRLEFIKSLAELVVQHASFGMGIVISNSEYERIIPNEFKRDLRGSVYFCLGHCLRLLIGHYNKLPARPPAPLLFMHDSKKGKEAWIAEWYYTVRNKFHQDNVLGDLSFGRRQHEPVLQAADLLVGELRRHREGHSSQVVEILQRKRNILVAFPDEAQMRDMVTAALEGPDIEQPE